MKDKIWFCSALVVIGVAGCAKPDDVKFCKSPYSESLSYTMETYRGHGAVDNDYTRIYVNAVIDGKEKRQEVLGGEYLETAKITWEDKANATICIPADGVVSAYHNLAILIQGRKNFIIHTHLKEGC